MRKPAIFTVLAICILSLAANAGHGYKHGKGHGHEHGKFCPKKMKEAGLSDQQIRRIEMLKDETEKKNIDLRHQLEKIHLELEALMKAYQVDKAKAFSLMEKAHALKLQKQKNWMEFKLNMRKEMTEAQWQKVRELHAGKGKHHGKHEDCPYKKHHQK